MGNRKFFVTPVINLAYRHNISNITNRIFFVFLHQKYDKYWNMYVTSGKCEYIRARYYNGFMIYGSLFYVKIMFQQWHILVAIFHILYPPPLVNALKVTQVWNIWRILIQLTVVSSLNIFFTGINFCLERFVLSLLNAFAQKKVTKCSFREKYCLKKPVICSRESTDDICQIMSLGRWVVNY